MVTLTPAASQKISNIMEEQSAVGAALRIMVTGMSCSGPQYMMSLDHEQQADDTLVEADGLRVLLDPDTAAVLAGSQIDYLEGLQRSGFTIVNPNLPAKGSCGGGCSCGAR